MQTRTPEIVVLTRDLAIAHAVTLAAPETWTEWHQTFSSILLAIKPGTDVLIVDGAMNNPLSRSLPTMFVDQRNGRRAIVLQPEGGSGADNFDPRVTMLPWPLSLEALSVAVGARAQPLAAHALPELAVAAA